MSFKSPTGPPASASQMRELGALLVALGYGTFREARGPLGFSQRQGGGKFTSEEAAELIVQLELELEGQEEGSSPAPTPTATPAASASSRARPKASARQAPKSTGILSWQELDAVPDAFLASALEHRGWIIIPPEEHTVPDPNSR